MTAEITGGEATPEGEKHAHVIYHAGCADGFGAAWAADTALRKEPGRTATYTPAAYGDSPPDVRRGSDVYILDFSYPLEQMRALAEGAGSITLIDHHATAQDTLEGKISGCHFDMEHSGAHLAWRRFHPDEPVPELLLYVEDRDLWKWEMPESREVSAAIDSHPHRFETWDSLEVEKLAAEGRAILRYQAVQVERIASGSQLWDIAGHRAPAVQSAVLASEVCELLLAQNPSAPFSAVYREQSEGNRLIRKWSLRGRSGGINVAEIAGAMGGGGHPQAAGFIQETKPGSATVRQPVRPEDIKT